MGVRLKPKSNKVIVNKERIFKMKVKDLAEKYSMKILNAADIETREAKGCYCGDLLSWVMSRANADDVWLTVMGNVNAVAVAVLTDCACILLTENSALDDAAEQRAVQQGITILRSDKNAYELSVLISGLL